MKAMQALGALILMAWCSMAAATTVGPTDFDPMNRSTGVGNTVFVTDLLTPLSGNITGWSVEVDGISGTAPEIGILIGELSGGNFTVTASDFQTVTTGVNTFATSLSVASGQNVGIFIGTAQVAFRLIASPNEIYWSGGNTVRSPVLADSFDVALTGGNYNRAFAFNFTSESAPPPVLLGVTNQAGNTPAVPLPAGLPLLIGAVGALAAIRMRRSAA